MSSASGSDRWEWPQQVWNDWPFWNTSNPATLHKTWMRLRSPTSSRGVRSTVKLAKTPNPTAACKPLSVNQRVSNVLSKSCQSKEFHGFSLKSAEFSKSCSISEDSSPVWEWWELHRPPRALYNGPCFAPGEDAENCKAEATTHSTVHNGLLEFAGQDWILQSASTFCSHRSANCVISLSRGVASFKSQKHATGSETMRDVPFCGLSRSSSIAMPVQRSAAASSLLCSILFSWLEWDPWRCNGKHKCQENPRT